MSATQLVREATSPGSLLASLDAHIDQIKVPLAFHVWVV